MQFSMRYMEAPTTIVEVLHFISCEEMRLRCSAQKHCRSSMDSMSLSADYLSDKVTDEDGVLMDKSYK